MNDFHTAPEKRGRGTGAKAAGALAALGICVTLGAAEVCRTAGVPVPVSRYLTRETVDENCGAYFKKQFRGRVQHDVPLVLTNGSEVIDFVADGWDSKGLAAYEWIGAQGYDCQPDYFKLDSVEAEAITKYRFGKYTIFVIRSTNERGFFSELYNFQMSFTNE